MELPNRAAIRGRCLCALVLAVTALGAGSGQASGASNEVAAGIEKVSSASSYEVRVTGRKPTAVVYTFVAPDNERSRSLVKPPVGGEQIAVGDQWFVETAPGSSRYTLVGKPPPANAPQLLATLAASIQNSKRTGSDQYEVLLAPSRTLAIEKPTKAIAFTRGDELRRLCIAPSRRSCRADIVVSRVGTAGPVVAPPPKSLIAGPSTT